MKKLTATKGDRKPIVLLKQCKKDPQLVAFANKMTEAMVANINRNTTKDKTS